MGDDQQTSANADGAEFSIFISYREEDEALAEAFAEQIKKLSWKQIAVHTFTDKSTPQYMSWVSENIRNSNLLIILHTDSSHDMEFINYEIGLFVGSRSDARSDIIWFRSEGVNKSPRILAGIEPRPLEPGRIKELLRHILYTKNFCDINFMEGDKDPAGDCEAAGEIIAEHIPDTVLPEFYKLRLVIGPIELSDTPVITDEKSEIIRHTTDGEKVLSFSGATVSTRDDVRQLLNLAPIGPISWQDFRETLDDSESGQSIPSDIMNIAHDDRLHGRYTRVLSTLKTEKSQFWPVISRIDRKNGIPTAFYIILIEDPTQFYPRSVFAWNQRVFDQQLKLVTLLNFTRRFRWNIIEPALYELYRHLTNKRFAKAYDAAMLLRQELDDMQRAGEAERLDVAMDVLSNFDDDEAREAMAPLWAEYYEKRGKLDEAIDAQDYHTVFEILVRYSENARLFMTTCIGQYAKLVERTETLEEHYPNWRSEIPRVKDSSEGVSVD